SCLALSPRPLPLLTLHSFPTRRSSDLVPHGDIHQLSGFSASGTNRLRPNRALSNAPISAWVPGETRNSANARPPATLMRGAFLGLSSSTWYTLYKSGSPSTSGTSCSLSRQARYVARSVSV